LASVAAVEARWNLVEKRSGVRMARAYVPNERISPAGRFPLVEGAPATLPAFILGYERRIEPLLVPVGTAGAGQAVGGEWKSKGAIVSETGAVLTAAPGQPPWDMACQWTDGGRVGALLVLEPESMRIAQVVPLARTQFPQWPAAESGFLAEQLPQDPQGPVRGRRVSKSDIRVEVTASIRVAGRTQEANLTSESSGLWRATLKPGNRFTGLRVPTFAGETSRPKDGQPVWVVGDHIGAGEIKRASGEGPIVLSASPCNEGAVVFDQEGRVLGLCVPGNRRKGGDGVAIPIRPRQEMSGGATDGHDW